MRSLEKVQKLTDAARGDSGAVRKLLDRSAGSINRKSTAVVPTGEIPRNIHLEMEGGGRTSTVFSPQEEEMRLARDPDYAQEALSGVAEGAAAEGQHEPGMAGCSSYFRTTSPEHLRRHVHSEALRGAVCGAEDGWTPLAGEGYAGHETGKWASRTEDQSVHRWVDCSVPARLSQSPVWHRTDSSVGESAWNSRRSKLTPAWLTRLTMQQERSQEGQGAQERGLNYPLHHVLACMDNLLTDNALPQGVEGVEGVVGVVLLLLVRVVRAAPHLTSSVGTLISKHQAYFRPALQSTQDTLALHCLRTLYEHGLEDGGSGVVDIGALLSICGAQGAGVTGTGVGITGAGVGV
ncbi:hypothetical protein B484DRAFT_424694, partial [Ochromonadaceae sp. CCMP2298]